MGGGQLDSAEALTGTYQVKGKIAEGLHPVEVALLLEMPMQKVVGIMLEGLKRPGIIEVVKEDPLQIKILTAQKAAHEYEEMFLQSFDTKGLVLSALWPISSKTCWQSCRGENLELRHRCDTRIL